MASQRHCLYTMISISIRTGLCRLTTKNFSPSRLAMSSYSSRTSRKPRYSVCRQFAVSGQCSFGDRCKFKHQTIKPSVVFDAGDSDTPINDFFAQYPTFDFDPSQPVYDEFDRMCEEFGWNDEKKKKKKGVVRRGLQNALVQQFNRFYGTQIESLESWQRLYKDIGIKPVPDDIESCKELIKGIHVNIVDLVDFRRTKTRHTRQRGHNIQVFDSVGDLSEYAGDTEKYFPREDAKAGELLKYLLRKIT
ncbi:hypothetical protein ABKN59_007822 [Abortiporus biennis]